MSAIKEKSLKYNLHSWSAQGAIDPTVITKAEGIYFWDEDGKKYIVYHTRFDNGQEYHEPRVHQYF